MMIEKVNKSDYEKTIRDLFIEDAELIDKYHIESGSGLENCVKRTASDMHSFSNYDLFLIKKDDETVSFFGKEIVEGVKFMTGFFIKKEYRTKEFVSDFWKEVKKTIGEGDIYSSIYKKNTRAADFLSKKGNLVVEGEVLTYKIF